MLLLFDLRSLKLKLGIVLVSQLVVIIFRHKIYIEYLELVYLVLILLISSGFFFVCVCVWDPAQSQLEQYLFIYLFFYLFIYLFVYKSEVLVTWFLVWMCRREKPWFQYTVSRLCFVGGHFFFQLLVFY